jgi:hypothetical protein
VVGLAREVLVDQVERVPAEEDVFVVHLAFAESCKRLVHEEPNIEFSSGFETFFLHPKTSVARSSK